MLEEACESYLDGYQERAQQALNRKKILWYRVCSEIYYLALMLKKDWFRPITFDRSIERIQELSKNLGKERGKGL